METSELEMTPPDSPKATKEEKKAPAPEDDLLGDLFPKAPPRDRSSIFYDRDYWSNYKTPEEDLLADLFPTAPPRDRSSIFYDREYWSNYKTPEDSGDTFHAQNGEPKSPESRARARERWPRLKAFSKSNCCA